MQKKLEDELTSSPTKKSRSDLLLRFGSMTSVLLSYATSKKKSWGGKRRAQVAELEAARSAKDAAWAAVDAAKTAQRTANLAITIASVAAAAAISAAAVALVTLYIKP